MRLKKRQVKVQEFAKWLNGRTIENRGFIVQFVSSAVKRSHKVDA